MKQKKCVDTLKVYNYIFLDFTQLFLLNKVNSFLIYHIHLSNLTCSYKCQSADGYRPLLRKIEFIVMLKDNEDPDLLISFEAS